jgi:hypothetical protein
MSKKGAEPGVGPVRPMDPEWRIKFKSTGVDKKKSPRKNSKEILKNKEPL